MKSVLRRFPNEDGGIIEVLETDAEIDAQREKYRELLRTARGETQQQPAGPAVSVTGPADSTGNTANVATTA